MRRARFLDVSATGGFADAVNIPFSELSQRLHELPPKHETVLVVGQPDAREKAIAFLRIGGRRAESAPHPLPPLPAIHRGEGVLRLWEPNELLQELADQLTPAHALDLGCGSGRDAVHLASMGWQVTAVDVLPDALEKGRDLQERYAPDAPAIEWVQADLEAYQPVRRCGLVCSFSYFCKAATTAALDALSPGGSLIIEMFTPEHRKRFGKPAHTVTEAEMSDLTVGLEVRHLSSGWRDSGRHTVRLWAVKA